MLHTNSQHYICSTILYFYNTSMFYHNDMWVSDSLHLYSVDY